MSSCLKMTWRSLVGPSASSQLYVEWNFWFDSGRNKSDRTNCASNHLFKANVFFLEQCIRSVQNIFFWIPCTNHKPRKKIRGVKKYCSNKPGYTRRHWLIVSLIVGISFWLKKGCKCSWRRLCFQEEEWLRRGDSLLGPGLSERTEEEPSLH